MIRQILGISERFDATMRLASGLVVVELEAKDDAESYRQQLRLRSQEDAVIAHLGNTTSISDFFAECGMDLCRMLDASAFAAVQGDDLYTAGKPPSDATVRDMATWVQTDAGGRASIPH